MHSDNEGDITHEFNVMAQQGSVSEDDLQINHILANLKQKLRHLEQILVTKESERDGVIEDINILTLRLKNLNKSIQKKKQIHDSYEKTLQDSESAFQKITDSTKMLLQVVKKENSALFKQLTAKDKQL